MDKQISPTNGHNFKPNGLKCLLHHFDFLLLQSFASIAQLDRATVF